MHPPILGQSGEPLVSVIIPAFNAEATIGAALDSLLRQTIGGWEALVIDDGSRDGTARAAARLAERDGRIRVLRQENRGLAAARNRGIDAARGRFLHFLDADDALLPTGLAALVSAASHTGAAYGGARWTDQHGADLGWSFEPSCPLVGPDELLASGRWAPCGQLISRDLLAGQRFDSAFAGVEDLDLWLRLAAGGVRWRAVDEDVCAYRLRPSSMSRCWRRMARGHVGAVEQAMSLVPGSAHAAHPARGRLLQRIALGYATGAALGPGAHAIDQAVEVLRPAAHTGPVSPADAARAAWWMLPYAACAAPSIWHEGSDNDLRPLCRAAAAFWRALEERSMAEVGLTARAAEALGALAVPAGAVAARIVHLAAPDRPCVVLGLGRNGRAAVRALSSAGRSFVVFDDALPSGTRAASVCGVECEAVGAVRAFSARNVHIVTPDADEWLMARVPRGAERIRWCAVRDALAAASRARLAPLWPQPAQHLSEAA